MKRYNIMYLKKKKLLYDETWPKVSDLQQQQEEQQHLL